MGDIVLTPDGPVGKKRRWKIVLIVMAFALAIGGGCFLIYYMVSRFENSNEKIIAVLSSDDVNNLRELEEVYFNAFYGNLTVRDLFSEENFDGFIEDTKSVMELREKIDRFNVNFVDSKIRDDFAAVRSSLNLRASMYQQTAGLVEVFRKSYIDGNAGLIEQYLDDETSVFYVARRFSLYFKEKEELEEMMIEESCDISKQSDVCDYINEEYEENESSLIDSSATAQALLATYDGVVYTNENLLYRQIKNILDMLEGER